jgi:hypothetical protein
MAKKPDVFFCALYLFLIELERLDSRRGLSDDHLVVSAAPLKRLYIFYWRTYA